MNALVLCLHQEGKVHIELLAKDAPDEESNCAGSDIRVSDSDCPPCTDISLASVDLGSFRSSDLESVQAPLPVALPLIAGNLTEAALHLRSAIVRPQLPRGPPVCEALSKLVSRFIVLRL